MSVSQSGVSRCPTCGTDNRADRFAMLDQGRAFDAGISGCPDSFHEDALCTHCGAFLVDSNGSPARSHDICEECANA